MAPAFFFWDAEFGSFSFVKPPRGNRYTKLVNRFFRNQSPKKAAAVFSGSFQYPLVIVTVIGGMGSIAGALVSALLIGMVRGFGTIGFPKFTDGLI